MGWFVNVLLSVIDPFLRWVAARSAEGLRKRYRERLRQRIAIESKGKPQIYEGFSYKPLGFELKIDSKGSDDVFIRSINCIFLFDHIPLQGMRWEEGDEWATNLTKPYLPDRDKIPCFQWSTVTLFLNLVPFSSLPSLVSSRAKGYWGLEVAIRFRSRFGDFVVHKDLSFKGDWKTICQTIQSVIREKLGIGIESAS